MDPLLSTATTPPLPSSGLLALVTGLVLRLGALALTSFAAFTMFVAVPFSCFELGRELSRYVSSDHIALVLSIGALALSALRSCRCAWLRR